MLSELRRPDRGDPLVLDWAQSIPWDQFYLSAITILEIEFGVLRLERKDSAGAAALRSWIDNRILPAFAGRILPIDETVARRCAALHIPDPRSDRDAFIAATALVHGMTVVTRNIADFRGTGVPLLNPWDAQLTGFHEPQATLR